MAGAANSQSRSWCFTLNNWQAAEFDSIAEWADVQYIVVGKEKGEEGTPHLQGAVTFSTPKRLSGVKKLLLRAHWESMKARDDSAFKYCKKDGDFYEKGEFKGQGKRSDLAATYAAHKAGKSLYEHALESECGYQALKVLELLDRHKPAEAFEKRVEWIYGATGTGKSRYAHELGACFVSKVGQFWTDYHGQEVICFDELRPSDLSRNELLRLLDRYPYQLNMKGRVGWIRAKTIVITSPLTPQLFWSGMKGDDEPVDQLMRRISLVKEMKKEEVVDLSQDEE